MAIPAVFQTPNAASGSRVSQAVANQRFATIVENLVDDTPVSAQFFLSRNIPETIDPNTLLPTIFPAASPYPLRHLSRS